MTNGRSWIELLENPLSQDEIKAQDLRAEASSRKELAPFFERIAKAERGGYSSLKENDWSISFKNISRIGQNKNEIDRVMNWGLSKGGVVLHGSVGTGKSWLCKALINKWASPTYRCKFISTSDAFKNIRSGIDNPESSIALECDKLIEPALLIFDDLGVDNVSDWTREQLFSIFEARSNCQRPTWFTTNLSQASIAKTYGERIYDRMIQYCSWIKLDGDSFRKMNFQNKI